MGILKQDIKFLSANGINTISGVVICKEMPPYKAIIQISHGMVEHIGRYEDFMNFMAGEGFIMVAHDHLGHKTSTRNDDDLGYFAKKNGYKYIIADLIKTADLIKDMFPQQKLFLLGHSMGSFYARVLVSKKPEMYDGIMISGTGGKNFLAGAGKTLVKILIKLKGDTYRSSAVEGLVFKDFLLRVENHKTPRDWLTRDEEIVEKTMQDRYSTFTFTLSGFRDLLTINTLANSSHCYNNWSKSMPTFIFSGSLDPVGEYGKGVTEVYTKLKNKNIEDLTLKIYEGGRHEMLNETNRDEVHQDLINWLETRI